VISLWDMIGQEWDLRLHRGSFLLGLAIGAAAGATVMAAMHAQQRRTRQREESRM